MSELSDLLVAIAALVPAVASAFVLVWNTVRNGRKPEQVAKSAAEETAALVLDALVDGELSAEELDAIRRSRRDQQGGDPT